jgi:hypothetical protein
MLYPMMDTSCDRIPRKEAERVARTVMGELGALQPGCVHTIVGGYVTLDVFPPRGGLRLTVPLQLPER